MSLAVNAVGFLRHLFDGFFPARRCFAPAGRGASVNASRLAAIISSRFHSARTGSAYFQLRTSPCSVMRIWPEKHPGGWARMAACVGPPPRPTVPPRPWNRRSFTPNSFAARCKFAVGLIEFPRAGEHASVFVGVGVAEHDLLPASPGIEQRAGTRDCSRAAA